MDDLGMPLFSETFKSLSDVECWEADANRDGTIDYDEFTVSDPRMSGQTGEKFDDV